MYIQTCTFITLYHLCIKNTIHVGLGWNNMTSFFGWANRHRDSERSS